MIRHILQIVAGDGSIHNSVHRTEQAARMQFRLLCKKWWKEQERESNLPRENYCAVIASFEPWTPEESWRM